MAEDELYRSPLRRSRNFGNLRDMSSLQTPRGLAALRKAKSQQQAPGAFGADTRTPAQTESLVSYGTLMPEYQNPLGLDPSINQSSDAVKQVMSTPAVEMNPAVELEVSPAAIPGNKGLRDDLVTEQIKRQWDKQLENLHIPGPRNQESGTPEPNLQYLPPPVSDTEPEKLYPLGTILPPTHPDAPGQVYDDFGSDWFYKKPSGVSYIPNINQQLYDKLMDERMLVPEAITPQVEQWDVEKGFEKPDLEKFKPPVPVFGVNVPTKSDVTTTTEQVDPTDNFIDVEPYSQLYNTPGAFGTEIITPSKPGDSALHNQVTKSYIDMLQGKSPAMEQNLRMAEGVLAKMAARGKQDAHQKAVRMGFKPGEKGYSDIMERENERMSSQGSNILSGLAAQNLAAGERATVGAGQFEYGQQKLGLGYDQLGAQTDIQKANQAMNLLGYSDLFSEGQMGAVKGNVGDVLGISGAKTWGQDPPTYMQNKVQEFISMGYDENTAKRKAQEAIALEDPNRWLQKMFEELDFGNLTTTT